ncbi:hypothetical protein AB0P02_18990 [Streptomyces griseoluteus]|uniref:hypothetical protein n=1 Tax=Streptomyces griseoluteus TaxID=29306 RepID=UPI003429B2AE
MTTQTIRPVLPRRSESGLRSHAINTAAGVLLAAQQTGAQTPTGLAFALDCAGLLNSPEHAAEFERMQARLAELKVERDAFADRVDTLTSVAQGNKRHVQSLYVDLQTALRERDAARARVAELEAERHTTNEALSDAAEALRANRDRIAEQRPADEDPIAYALTDQADGITRHLAPVQALRKQPAPMTAPAPPDRVSRLLDAIRTHRGEWTTHKVMELYRAFNIPAPKRSTARSDLRLLHAMGHLVLSDTEGRRFYTLKTRKSA